LRHQGADAPRSPIWIHPGNLCRFCGVCRIARLFRRPTSGKTLKVAIFIVRGASLSDETKKSVCDGGAAPGGPAVPWRVMLMRTLAGYLVSAWLAMSIAGASLRADTGALRRLPAVAASDEQEPSLEERFEKLEEQLKEQSETIDNIQSDLEQVVHLGHSSATMKLVGRIHADYWTFPHSDPDINLIETGNPAISPQDELGFRRIRLGVQGDLPSNMVYRFDIEFSGGNAVEFRDATLGWKDLPFFQTLLIGNQKRPYGQDTWQSSRYTVFMERPFNNDAFNQNFRRFGVQSWGISEDLRYNWQYGVFNQRDIQDEGAYLSDHLQPQLAGRFASTWWYDETSNGRGYGHAAIAGTIADTDQSSPVDPAEPGAARAVSEARFRARSEAQTAQRWLDTGVIRGAGGYQLFGLEGVLNVGPVQILGEYMNVWLQREAGFGDDLFFHGAYVYVSYFLTGEHMPWDRETGQLDRPEPFENFFLVERCRGGVGHGWGAWQTAVRLDYIDLTDAGIFGGEAEAVTFGLNWYWTPYARMQFNYIVGALSNRRLDADDPADPLLSGDYQSIGLRVMTDF
jgi:phosphate-selective porin OprO/OprP